MAFCLSLRKRTVHKALVPFLHGPPPGGLGFIEKDLRSHDIEFHVPKTGKQYRLCVLASDDLVAEHESLVLSRIARLHNLDDGKRNTPVILFLLFENRGSQAVADQGLAMRSYSQLQNLLMQRNLSTPVLILANPESLPSTIANLSESTIAPCDTMTNGHASSIDARCDLLPHCIVSKSTPNPRMSDACQAVVSKHLGSLREVARLGKIDPEYDVQILVDECVDEREARGVVEFWMREFVVE